MQKKESQKSNPPPKTSSPETDPLAQLVRKMQSDPQIMAALKHAADKIRGK